MLLRTKNFDASSWGILIVIGLIGMLVAVGAAENPRFLTLNNLVNVWDQSSGLIFVSLGQTLTVLTGGIDVSVGSAISLLASLASGLINGVGARTIPVCLGVVALGVAIGIVNGAGILMLRIHPLIMTLGMSAILQGVVLLYTLGPIGRTPLGFSAFAYGRVYGVPVGATLSLALALALAFFLRHYRLGRHIYALGDDPVAAKLSGLPVGRITIFVYGAAGFCAGVTALYLVSRFGVGQPYSGTAYTLTSITPVVVGGTTLAGGRGGVIGTVLGCYLISLLNNVVNFMGVSTHVQLMLQGLIIIAAVSIYAEQGSARR
jgi:ribose transport system permease protein